MRTQSLFFLVFVAFFNTETALARSTPILFPQQTGKTILITKDKSESDYFFKCDFGREKTLLLEAHLNWALGKPDKVMKNNTKQWYSLTDKLYTPNLSILLQEGTLTIQYHQYDPDILEDLEDMTDEVVDFLQESYEDLFPKDDFWQIPEMSTKMIK